MQAAGRGTGRDSAEVTLTAKSMVYAKGTATWDSAFETLVEAFKSVYGYLDKEGLTADGPAMTIYTATDDTGWSFCGDNLV